MSYCTLIDPFRIFAFLYSRCILADVHFSYSPDGMTMLLPLGIQLMGGAKLRQDGKTGKGIKVAVID